jgi:uncharacterized membrane protein YccF (DUF307 family)
MLKVLANIIWMLFGGLWLSLMWALAGILLCITIVGIPFGLQCFKAARLSLFPYGKKVALDYGKHPVANVLWAIFGGWSFAFAYLIAGVLNCISIIGISSGLQCFKIMKLAFFPFGAKIEKR